jgi:acyl carrier protein
MAIPAKYCVRDARLLPGVPSPNASDAQAISFFLSFRPATVLLLQHLNNFERKPYCRVESLDLLPNPFSALGGLAMSIAGLTSTEQTTAIEAVFVANDVRALIANHLGISVSCVTDEAHFTTDLGADWLDRLDLMMAVEDRFAGVENHR